MIDRLYSDFDTDITIRSAQSKTFYEQRIDLDKLSAIEGVVNYSRAVEEVVILKHEKKWLNANMFAVDSTFLEMAHMEHHMIDGVPKLELDEKPVGLIGATLLDKLEGFIPRSGEFEQIICYAPKRKLRIRPGKNPFNTEVIKLVGRVNYNREVNGENLIVPLEVGQQLMEYKDHISAIYVDCENEMDRQEIKSTIQHLVGEDFEVKTNYEKNELIYKTSKSEKIIVMIILLFIFILAAFNLVASLTMLFVEKLDNLKTIISFGASKNFIFRIFFYEGLLISGKGILIGAILGYAICIAQINFGFITMPNSAGEAFPMSISLFDGCIILFSVALLSTIFSFFPVKYLTKKNIQSTNQG